jgi:hypothetical protein
MALMRKHLLLVGVLLFVSFISRGSAQVSAIPTATENGTLIVLITWGDVDNTPADDVYIEAHTVAAKSSAPASYVLTKVHPGRYESTLPPGVYDVFVSEGSSVPRCRRVQIRPKFQSYWTVKLEIDDVYINKN